MPFTPISGAVAVLKFGATTAPGTDWKIDIDPHAKDVSNFTTGRLRVKTLADAKCTMKLIWDSANQPIDPAGLNLVDGAAVTAKCFTDATHFFLVPGIVTKVSPHVSGLEDVVMYDVEVDLSGATVTYPVVP